MGAEFQALRELIAAQQRMTIQLSAGMFATFVIGFTSMIVTFLLTTA